MLNTSTREIKIAVVDSKTPVGQEDVGEYDQIVRESSRNDAVILTRKLGDFTAEGMNTPIAMMQYKIFCQRIGSWKKITELEQAVRSKLGDLEYDKWKIGKDPSEKIYTGEFVVESMEPVNASFADDDDLHPIAYTYRIFVTSWGRLTVEDIQSAMVSVFRF